MAFPDDLLLNAADEVTIRQHLTLVALGKKPADLAIEVGRLLAVHSRKWLENRRSSSAAGASPISGRSARIAARWRARVKHPDLSAVPGFGEVHKHIESTHITPEFEAALVLPRGNTWTCEASHEFANVNGAQEHRVLAEGAARRLAAEGLHPARVGGAAECLGRERRLLWLRGAEASSSRDDLSVTSLDEVMDWPSVWDPNNPGYERMWGMIGATFEMRGVVEGHGSGLTDPHDISAFVAAGLSLRPRGLGARRGVGPAAARLLRRAPAVLLRRDHPGADRARARGLVEHRLHHRRPHRVGDAASSAPRDYNVRHAIHYGLAPEIAIQCATINPARHMRIDQWVGSITPGRYADIVLLDDVPSLSIAHVYADGAAGVGGQDLHRPAARDRLAGLGDGRR